MTLEADGLHRHATLEQPVDRGQEGPAARPRPVAALVDGLEAELVDDPERVGVLLLGEVEDRPRPQLFAKPSESEEIRVIEGGRGEEPEGATDERMAPVCLHEVDRDFGRLGADHRRAAEKPRPSRRHC